ncbi:MAG: ABC transporter ATP-binding protein [Timaviella obliquedivisa GSE-PSE-MK23-08B]|jgi:lipopolysaccharide transport system ATP-binding protein|nr:ABC transporter ATP-binding protein [Timaviella obliquedivisa GSE-PSE-MK23-08B]
MSNPIIRVENLSKKYTVSHQQEGYTTFRDAMTNGARSLGQALFNRKNVKPRSSSNEDFWALKDVNFEIQQGDRVGIIGRNGAGKSTLLKILSRITEPTHGSIRIKGRVASLLEVGTGFHPELTGRENVFLNGAILGMEKTEIKRKFDEIVAFAEIERFLDTPVKRYSSGMYVRLAFAVAAHLEPEVLIVDEVLAVGDSAFQKKCLGKMETVANEGRTVIFVSHSMETVTRLCNTAILLENGSVKSSGRTEQVVHAYLKSDFGTTARRSWRHLDKAPGNNIARLVEVNVHNEDGKIMDNFDITKPVGITMVYEVLKSDAVFTHSINLFNENGVHILSSHDITSEMRKKPRAKGYYSSTMWVPGNFLSEGMVAVSVAIIEQDPFVIYFHELDAVAFNVTDSINGLSARGNYVQHFPGVVRPILNWETSRIAQNVMG